MHLSIKVEPPKVPKSHDDTFELRILLLINKNPRINQGELSQQFDVSLPTRKRAMFGMVEKGVLESKGGKRVCILLLSSNTAG